MDYMLRALELARKAVGTTSPNPAVGAVIVRDGEIVGEGHTLPPGSDHAEIVALKQAGERAKGAVLYVTLEPCCHTEKRTPPCTHAIIGAGIAEVHIAVLDPNPKVSGRGQAELDAAGIRTFLGEHEEEAREINENYFKFIVSGIPFVAVKFAMSLDGKIATVTGESRWITGEASRRLVHELRRRYDAIMVGINTVLRDDPQLTARDDGQIIKAPLRVIVDSRCRTPSSARLLRQPGETLIATAGPMREELRRSGVTVVAFPGEGGLVDLKELLHLLGRRGITGVLVEGGGRIIASLLSLNLVDKIYAFIAPIIIGGEAAPTPVAGRGVESLEQSFRLKRVAVEEVGEDILIKGYLR